MNPLLMLIALAVVLLHGPGPARAATIAAAPAGVASSPGGAAPAKVRGTPDPRAEFDDFADAGDSLAAPAGPAVAVLAAAAIPATVRVAAPGPAEPDTGALLVAVVGFVGTVAVRRSQRNATT